MRLVVDTSALVDLVLGRPGRDAVDARIRAHDFDLHAPELLVPETTNALRRLVRGGHVGAERAGEALVDALDLGIELHSHRALVPRVWELRDVVTPYDAMFLVLAEAIPDGALLTRDARLADAARTHSAVRVELI